MARTSQRENYIVKTLNGMAYGFFASLIIGTILKQVGYAIHWNDLVTWGQMASYLMGPAIGVGIAFVLDAKGLNMIAAVIAGAIDRKSTRLNSSHALTSRMPSSA